MFRFQTALLATRLELTYGLGLLLLGSFTKDLFDRDL